MSLQLSPLSSNASSRVPVIGISEWQTWPEHPDTADVDTLVDDCIQAHREAGIDQLAWNCGRSTLHYQSDIPSVTPVRNPADSDIPEMRLQARLMERYCPLRQAIERCRSLGMPIMGRLAMNRHYDAGKQPDCTSRFAADHPQYQERGKNGNIVPDKLCYAIDRVCQERIDILMEIQSIGVEGLLLDFCRQVPILLYHEALVEPYKQKNGVDPRKIDSDRPEDYQTWWQYRADVLTAFMQKLRQQVRKQERQLGRDCPIIARIPDNNAWITLAFGLDMQQWFEQDLIDATMLSPFPLVREDLGRHPVYHIEMAHQYHKACIGGIGSLNLIRGNYSAENSHPDRYYDPKPVYQLADLQYQAGADAMSLYQSEVLIQQEYLKSMIREIGDRELVARRAAELPEPSLESGLVPLIGCDWHSVRPAVGGLKSIAAHGLRVSEAGIKAL